MTLPLDQRPVIVALAGSNGAGKTTFYHLHLQEAALRFIEPDKLAKELKLDPYTAARMAGVLREQLLKQRESFVFETVFSDPKGVKLDFLNKAAKSGYNVVLCFIGISSPEVSEERVARRISHGGHDVPPDKLVSRFPRTLANLKSAIRQLPHVWIFDNDDQRKPFRQVAVFQDGHPEMLSDSIPSWLRPLLP